MLVKQSLTSGFFGQLAVGFRTPQGAASSAADLIASRIPPGLLVGCWLLAVSCRLMVAGGWLLKNTSKLGSNIWSFGDPFWVDFGTILGPFWGHVGSQNGPGGSQNGPPSGQKSRFFDFWVIFVIALKKRGFGQSRSPSWDPFLGPKTPQEGPKGPQDRPKMGPKSSQKGWSTSRCFFVVFFIDFVVKMWSKNGCFLNDCWMIIQMC